MSNLIEDDSEIVAKPPIRVGRPYGALGAKATIAQAQKMMDLNSKKLLPIIGEHYAKLQPMEIMLIAARLSAFQGNWSDAVSYSAAVAPYFHRRLASVNVDHTISTNFKDMSDSDLQAYLTVSDAVCTELTSSDEILKIDESKD